MSCNRQEDAYGSGNSSRDHETNQVHNKTMLAREVADGHDGCKKAFSAGDLAFLDEPL